MIEIVFQTTRVRHSSPAAVVTHHIKLPAHFITKIKLTIGLISSHNDQWKEVKGHLTYEKHSTHTHHSAVHIN